MEIAYLASRVTLPGSPTRRPDAHEHDQTIAALEGPLHAAGFGLTALSWDTPGVDWSRFAGVLIGTTWDYWDRQADFLDTLAHIEARTRLFNPVAMEYPQGLSAGACRCRRADHPDPLGR